MNGRSRKSVPAFAAALAASILMLLAGLPGCGGGEERPLVVAASVDLEDSGILGEWVEDFRAGTGKQVELHIVPDDEALGMLRHGECDLALTHDYEGEESLQRSGFVEEWHEVMRGDYVLVGPPDDPAGIADMESAVEAFRKIADGQQGFVMRIDGSGTANRQNYLFSLSGVEEAGGWLLVMEGGMEDALREASRAGDYTLATRGDFERLAGELDLEILLEGHEALEDAYRTAAVSEMVYPDSDTEGAGDFVDYLLSDDARRFFELGAWKPPEVRR